MSSPRVRLALVAAVVVALLVGAVLWANRSPEPAPAAAQAPVGTIGTAAPSTTVATTTASYRSVVATATVPELEVFAAKPADPADPEAPSSPGGVAATTAPPTVAAAGSNLQPIPRVGLSSAGSRKTDTGWAFSNPTSFGSPLVVPVTEVADDWLRVEIPARPNSQEGWIRASDVTLSESEFRMELTLSDFTLRVFQGDAEVLETQVVIGTDYTKTPVGTFYLGEILTSQQAGVGGPNGAYGPFILATSAYSESMELFDGGLPVIAFHGTNNPGLVGSKASNGCVRMPNEVITQLAGMVPAGTVVIIKE